VAAFHSHSVDVNRAVEFWPDPDAYAYQGGQGEEAADA